MRPKNIFIVRHGVSMSNLDASVHDKVPDWKIDMHPSGIPQCLAAACEVIHDIKQSGAKQNLAVYLSPYARTRQTWKHMFRQFDILNYENCIGIPIVREDPRLREQEWAWNNGFRLDWIEAQREEFGAFYYRIPGGESGADVYDRCTMFLSTLYRDFECPDFPENVLVITHGFTMRALVMRWIHASVEEFHTWKNPENCKVVKLSRFDDKHYGVYKGFDIK